MYQWCKSIRSWKVGKELHQSIPFTWMLPEAQMQAMEHNGITVIGGPAIKLAEHYGFYDLSWGEVRHETPFDVLSFHNPLATFTSRGCPNRCGYCAVPIIEGEFVELKSWKAAPIICDNNILAASKAHFELVIDSLMAFKCVDFNQGLDARLFSEYHAKKMKSLHHVKVRFALDRPGMEDYVSKAVDLARYYGLKDISIYCIIGYKDSPQSARDRLEMCRSMGIRPNPTRYQPLNILEKNSYLAPGWTESEMRKMMKYYSRLRWLEHIPYGDFDYLKHDERQEAFEF